MHTQISPAPRHRLGHIAVLFALLAAFFLAPATAAQATGFPDGYPKMGKSQESQAGYLLKASSRSYYATTLFPVYTKAGNTPNQLAYCVELSVGAKYNIGLNVGGWDTFPGKNNFANDEAVRSKIAWIVYNSFPNKSLDEVAAKANVKGLTEKEAITATQAAIWSLSDSAPAQAGFSYKGFALENGKTPSAEQQKRVDGLFEYLSGVNNTGRPEVLEPSLSVEVTSVAGKAGSLVGPITINASEDTVKVTTDAQYPLVDGNGNEVDLNKVPGQSALYLKVPAGAAAGKANVTVDLTGSRFTGLLITNTVQRTQSLMISASDEVTETATGTIEWEVGASLATTARDEATEGKFLTVDGTSAVIDSVEYTGLTAGEEYELRGELMVREGTEAVATGITATQKFTPKTDTGLVDLRFEVPQGELTGKVVVAFERLYKNDVEVAVHTDIMDENQTVYSPSVETDAYDLSDSDQILGKDGGTLRDRITYSGLRTGDTYVVRGEVMDKATGETTGITAETTFTAGASAGVVDVDFEIPADHAGKTLVVFERLYTVPAAGSNDTEQLVAAHTDINDARQTVTVSEKPAVEEPQPEEPGDEETPDKEIPADDVDVEPGTDDTDETPSDTPEENPTVEETPTEEPVEEDVLGEVEDQDNTSTTDNTNSELAETGFNATSAVVIAAIVLLLAGGGIVIYQRKFRKE